MNILYIAYSCDPYKGSEDKIGWNIPVENSKTNTVYVITKEEQRKSIEKYISTHNLNSIEFHYIDIPGFYKKLFKGFLYSGRLNIWHRHAFFLAQKLCAEKKIDIIHQITPVEFRAIGSYGKISNVKFVCGPLGGGEFVPYGLKDYMAKKRIVELTRMLVNYIFRFWFKITKRYDKCNYIMFANDETRDFLLGIINTKKKIACSFPITEIGVDEYEIKEIEKRNKIQGTCTFLVVGRIIYRKGHEFLLDALSGIPEHLDYTCRIIGDGPDIKQLKERCTKDQYLSKHVEFVGTIPHMVMEQEYIKANALIMPSIRETTGTVLLEAMSKGIPIITIGKFGGALLLDKNTGWLFRGQDKISYIENLRRAIIEAIEQPGEVEKRGENAREYARRYTWVEKSKQYNKIYDELMD